MVGVLMVITLALEQLARDTMIATAMIHPITSSGKYLLCFM